MVPVSSMICMVTTLLIALGIPSGLFLWLRLVKKADILPFFVGCGVMLLFAFVLEQFVHTIVLGSPAGEAIRGNIWLYALYGGMMAGLFEETGRYLAFRTVLKKKQDRDVNALMYGAGHGGFEALAILGAASINNLITSVMINTGSIQSLLDTLPEELLPQMQTAVDALCTTPFWLFLVGGVERVFAVILHLSLSVLVWFAAKKAGRLYLYPTAILLHCAVDAVTVILAQNGLPVLLTEAVVGLLAGASAVLAYRVWKAESTEPAPYAPGYHP